MEHQTKVEGENDRSEPCKFHFYAMKEKVERILKPLITLMSETQLCCIQNYIFMHFIEKQDCLLYLCAAFCCC